MSTNYSSLLIACIHNNKKPMICSKTVSPVEVYEYLHVSVEPATILTEPWPKVKLAFES